MTTLTIKDLEAAQAKLDGLNEKWDRYIGNNPGKYRSDIRAAARAVERIHRTLNELGVLPWSAHDLLENELDKAYPNARSNQVVEHRGKSYERCWVSVERDKGDIFPHWQGYWVAL
jgi:hypothetical protein